MSKVCYSYILNLLIDLFDLVAHFFKFLKIASFVELERFYRMVYKRNGEEIDLIKKQAYNCSLYRKKGL